MCSAARRGKSSISKEQKCDLNMKVKDAQVWCGVVWESCSL